MRARCDSVLFFLGLLAISWHSSVNSVLAGPLTNGNFSNGLAGWTATDPNFVTVASQQATIRESDTASEVDLYQDFTFPALVKSLSFELTNLTTNSLNVTPDAFGASLLNPNTGLSLVPTVDPFTDSFYIRDLTNGTTQGQAAPGVTVSPSPTAIPLVITVDTSALGGLDARILFRVISGDDTDSPGASVSLTNVQVNGAAVVVPEPRSWILPGMCLLGMICRTIRARR